MTQFAKNKQVLIIGAGIGGLTLARRLLLGHITPEIYEASTEVRSAGGGLIIPPNSARILEQLGLEEVFQEAIPLEQMQIYDANGQLLYRRRQADVRKQYGHGLWAISRAVLHKALVASVGTEHIFTEHRLVDINDHHAMFYPKKMVTADLFVGADGALSRCREVIFPEAILQPTGQITIRGVAEHQASQPIFTEYWGANMRFTHFPINEHQVYWHASLPAMSTAHLHPTKTELINSYEAFPLMVSSLIRATSQPMIVNELRDLPPMKHWFHGRVALLGDAVHTTSPHLGQGAAQAVEDAMALGTMLVQEPDWDRALERYQVIRENKAAEVILRSREMGDFAQASGVTRFFRNIGMRINPDIAKRRIEAFYE